MSDLGLLGLDKPVGNGLLAKALPAAHDRSHGMRHALMIPLSEEPAKVRERFGCDIYTLFREHREAAGLRIRRADLS